MQQDEERHISSDRISVIDFEKTAGFQNSDISLLKMQQRPANGNNKTRTKKAEKHKQLGDDDNGCFLLILMFKGVSPLPWFLSFFVFFLVCGTWKM